MDVFERIAAAVLAIKAGSTGSTDPTLAAHIAAIDQHLLDTDAHELADSSDEAARIAVIEAGLAKVANALSPPAAPAATDTLGGGAGTDSVTDTLGGGAGTDTLGGGAAADTTAAEKLPD